MNKIVFVEKLAKESKFLEEQFLRSFKLLSLPESFQNAKAVFIKPNLTYPCYKPGVTTRKEFIESLVAAFRKINQHTKIYIGEGEGGYNSFSMTEALKNMGFFELEKKFSNVKIVNLSFIPSVLINIDTLKGPYKIALPELFFNEIDFSISCPLPKIHCMTQISLSYKNQWGCIPDIMRMKNHYMFNYIISKIANLLKFKFAFLDGKYGLDNNGPMVGDPVELNWFAASNSLAAFDTVISDMMGISWKKVKHLRIAQKYGFIPKKSQIRVVGNPASMQRKFVLKRNFWNYPALAAFHSRWLTHFFYFSIWAKLLHNIMYTFRRRPIN